jgi:hypothetical protein
MSPCPFFFLLIFTECYILFKKQNLTNRRTPVADRVAKRRTISSPLLIHSGEIK